MLVPKYKDMDGEVIVVVYSRSLFFFFPKIWKRFKKKKKRKKKKKEEEENVNLNLNMNLDAIPTTMN